MLVNAHVSDRVQMSYFKAKTWTADSSLPEMFEYMGVKI